MTMTGDTTSGISIPGTSSYYLDPTARYVRHWRRYARHLRGRNENPCADLGERCRNDNASGADRT